MHDILPFKIESGDHLLHAQFGTFPENAPYTSVQIEHELITEQHISQKIVDDVKCSVSFSVLADETVDITRKEQLSLCVRYANNEGII